MRTQAIIIHILVEHGSDQLKFHRHQTLLIQHRLLHLLVLLIISEGPRLVVLVHALQGKLIHVEAVFPVTLDGGDPPSDCISQLKALL